ncbi:hypothetical protein ACP4OV_024616 [Aristida adscensionis]
MIAQQFHGNARTNFCDVFAYSLIIAPGYRTSDPFAAALPYSIAIGGVLALLVNVLVVPAWAGVQLHRPPGTGSSSSFAAVADFA